MNSWRSTPFERMTLATLGMFSLFGCGGDYQAEDLACPAGSISQVITASGMDVGVKKTSFGGRATAQSVTPAIAISVTKVKLMLKSVGLPTGTVSLAFFTDNAGSPGTQLGDLSTVTISTTNITTSGRYVTFTFSTGVPLTAGTKYWVKLDGSYTASDVSYVSWMGADGDPYTTGNALYETSTPGTWSTAIIGTGRDLAFIIGC